MLRLAEGGRQYIGDHGGCISMASRIVARAGWRARAIGGRGIESLRLAANRARVLVHGVRYGLGRGPVAKGEPIEIESAGKRQRFDVQAVATPCGEPSTTRDGPS